MHEVSKPAGLNMLYCPAAAVAMSIVEVVDSCILMFGLLVVFMWCIIIHTQR